MEGSAAMKQAAQHNPGATTADSLRESERRRPAACLNRSCLLLQMDAVTKTRAVQLSGSAFQISRARCGMLACWAPKFPEGLLEGLLALLGRDVSRI